MNSAKLSEWAFSSMCIFLNKQHETNPTPVVPAYKFTNSIPKAHIHLFDALPLLSSPHAMWAGWILFK